MSQIEVAAERNPHRQLKMEPFGILAAALIANALVLTALPWPSVAGAILLLFILPGWAMMLWIRQFSDPLWAEDTLHQWLERAALGIGLSIVCATLTGLAVHYLPGPVSRGQVLIVCNAAIAMFLLLGWPKGKHVHTSLRAGGIEEGHPPVIPAAGTEKQTRILFLALLAILLMAAFYRFVWLGYSEFQGDEALVTWSAARSLTGEEDILFLHGKSPAEIILPANLWALTGWFNEWIARLPFALASWTAVLVAYLMGRRLFGQRVGLLAMFFFAINGYFIGFARVVQYQSLVILMSMLTVYAAYRAAKDRVDAYQVFSALFVGVGLLAHYDAVLVLPVVIWLWLMRFRADGQSSIRKWRNTGLALVLLLLTLAAFYLPMSRDLQFTQMVSYLAGSRVGTNLLNNHVGFFLMSGTVYNASYYTVALVILFLGVLWRTLRPLPRGYYIAGLFMTLMVSTVLWPGAWLIGQVNLAVVPYAIALLLAWLSPLSDRALRTVWLWLAATLLPYVFILALPLSHIYTIMPPLILLAAFGLHRAIACAEGHQARFARVKYATYALAAAIAFILAYYPYLVFVDHTPEFTQAYMTQPVPLYWRPEATLPRVGLFGFPHRSGWKAVGQWYAGSTLTGDYLSNEEEWVTLWYTRLAPRSCRPDAQYYFVASNPWDAVSVPQDLIDTGYDLTRVVTVEDTPQLYVYAPKTGTPLPLTNNGSEIETDQGAVPVLDVSQVESAFDRDTAPARFVQNTIPQYALPVDFRDEITLRGYDLNDGHEGSSPLQTGGKLSLTLYWDAQAAITQDYHVFVQLGEGQLWGQADSVPVCNRLPTSLWRPGKVVIDRYRIDLSPDTPSGRYPLRIGLYLPETGERLAPLQHDAGDNSVILTEVEVR